MHDVGKITVPDSILLEAGEADAGGVRADENAYHEGCGNHKGNFWVTDNRVFKGNSVIT